MAVFELEANGKVFEVEAPDQSAAVAAFQKMQGGPKAEAPSMSRDPLAVGEDVAKSGGIGIVKGGLGVLGLPGDVRGLAALGTDWASAKLGVDPAKTAQFKDTMYAMAKANPMLAAFTGPGSQELQQKVEGVTGEFYKPKTVAGEYAERIGEFAPSAIGPGGVAAKAARVMVPAVASETAGQATKGTAAEPYARLAGALTGGVATARLGKAASTVPSKEALFKEADAGYTAARDLGTEYKSSAVQDLALRVRTDLNAMGIDDTVADKTFKTLSKLENAPAGSFATYSNMDNMRKTFGNIAGSLDPAERKAAVIAKKAMEDFVENPNPASVIRGDAVATGELSKTARANSAAAHRAKELDKKEVRAEIRASAANSGQNVGNTMRQRVADMLIKNTENPGGYNADELAQMKRVVEGTKTGNAARYVGNLLGGGGGLGQALVGGGAIGASYASGDPRFLALPAIGVAGRAIGNASTMRQVEKLNELIRSRAPLAEVAKASAPKATQRELAAIVRALMGAQAEGIPLRMAMPSNVER